MKKYLAYLAVFVIFAFTGLSCGGNTTPTDTTSASPSPVVTLNQEPLVTADAASSDAVLTADFEAANKAAKAWDPNATLYVVAVKLPADFALSSSTQTYTYGSTNQPNYWWTYSLSEATQKYVRALVYKDDYLGSTITKPINQSFWRTNYIEAFQIAENYQGTDFRANNANTTVNLTLMTTDPKGWLWWLVEYKSPDGQSLTVRINPNDKSIVDESGNVVANGSTYTPASTTSDIAPTPTTTQ